jgi:hypothetical protein
MIIRDKHYTLFRKLVNYLRKKIYNIEPGANFIKYYTVVGYERCLTWVGFTPQHHQTRLLRLAWNQHPSVLRTLMKRVVKCFMTLGPGCGGTT